MPTLYLQGLKRVKWFKLCGESARQPPWGISRVYMWGHLGVLTTVISTNEVWATGPTNNGALGNTGADGSGEHL